MCIHVILCLFFSFQLPTSNPIMAQPLNLINVYDLEQRSAYHPDVFNIRSTVNYCESRFCAALRSIARARPVNRKWMAASLREELVLIFVKFRHPH
jgi:hypothetical protein